MDTKESRELKAKGLIALDVPAKEIAEKTGVPYQKVLSLKKGMLKEQDNDLLGKARAIDPEVLSVVVEKAKEEAPAKVVKQLENIQEGLTGLQMLDNEFHTTFSLILGKAEDFLARDDLKPSEWVSITNALSGAYNNIFNNSGVSVHVDQSTNVNSSKLAMFKGAMRG